MLKELLWWWWWWLRTFFEVGLKINKNVAKSTKMLQFRSINCNFLHFLAIICNSVQLLAILCNNLQFRAIAFNFLQYLAEYCATSCNLVITCNYILLYASSRSWILLNLVNIRRQLFLNEIIYYRSVWVGGNTMVQEQV